MPDAAGKLRFISEQIVLPDGRTVGEALGPADRGSWRSCSARRSRWTRRAAAIQPSTSSGARAVEVRRGRPRSALAEAVLEPGTDVVIAAGDIDQAAIVLGHLDGYSNGTRALGSLVVEGAATSGCSRAARGSG